MKRYIHYLFIALAFLTFNSFAQNVKTYIPVQAPKLLPIVKSEAERLMPELDIPWYFGGLIEQESCISLKHSKCWNALSQLKTSRELGVGLGMITKAYREDGSVRFDALQEMKDSNKVELKDLSWDTLRDRPDLQIRTMVLQIRGNFNGLYLVTDKHERLKMADSAYNGGKGGLNSDRRACGMAKGCDPQIWDGNVERYSMKSRKPIYGTRSPFSINREHVRNIFDLRMDKYEPYF